MSPPPQLRVTEDYRAVGARGDHRCDAALHGVGSATAAELAEVDLGAIGSFRTWLVILGDLMRAVRDIAMSLCDQLGVRGVGVIWRFAAWVARVGV